MDTERFDALTRSLPDAGSRRGLLAAALGGAAALLGLAPPGTSVLAAKDCKGLRGDKKKKCVKKARARDRECRNDGDCADRSTSCQRGKCRVVCPEGSCSGCTGCVTNLIAENEREQVCAFQLTQVAPDTCATDADCTGNATDVCLRLATTPCTQSKCGICFALPIICVAP